MKGKRANTFARIVVGAALLIAGSAQAQMQLSFGTIAGGGPVGDGGQAKAANLHGADSVGFDAAGNMYIVQYRGNRIRKVTPAGVISTIAGGNNGFGGDGGQASQALINHPSTPRFDAAGNLYFLDVGNRRVRKIATNGVITTVAGNGQYGSTGDGGQAKSASFMRPSGLTFDKNGNLYVADVSARRIRKITPTGVISAYAGTGEFGGSGDNGPAIAATFVQPYGIDFDTAGNLYVADYYTGAVRRITPGGNIATYQTGSSGSYDVLADAKGNVWIANADCTLTRRTATTTTTYGDSYCMISPEGAPAQTASFGAPSGLATDSTGNLYFADPDNARVAKITLSTDLLTTVAGTKPLVADGTAATATMFSSINALAVDYNGNVGFSDRMYNWTIGKISAGKYKRIGGAGTVTYADCPYPCTPLKFEFLNVTGIAAAPDGGFYVADRARGQIFKLRTDGTMISIAGGGGDRDGENIGALAAGINAYGLAADTLGNLYLADNYNNRIRKVTMGGINPIVTIAGTRDSGVEQGTHSGYEGDGGPAKKAYMYRPTQITVDAAHNVLFYDANRVVRRITTDGIIRRVAGVIPGAVAWSDVFTGEGGLATSAQLGVYVSGIAAHSTGVYIVADGALRRVRPDGKIETVNGLPYYAQGVTVKGQYLYVSTDNGRIVRALLPRKANADFNGDGKTDVLWRDTAGNNSLWLSANSATKQAVTLQASTQKLAGQGDFDGDGKADIVWRNTSTGANVIWRSGNSTATIAVTAMADQNWTIAGVGNFNGDTKADLLWRNKLTGQNQIWYSGSSAVKGTLATQADLKVVVAGIGDFDGDGRSDILWRNTVTGANTIWSAGNSATLRPVASVTNLKWKVAAVADFNGDGVTDILWRDTATGSNVIWRAADSARQQAVVGITNLQWSVAAAGDYDNDGIADILWRNSTTGENVIWKNASNATQKAVTSVGGGWKAQPFEAQP